MWATGSIVGPPDPPPLPGGDSRQGGGDGALLPGALPALAPAPWLWVALAHPAAPEPSRLSRPCLLWLYLLVPVCTLRAPCPSSWGLGRWDYSGDPTLSTHQRIHIRANGWEHPRTQEQCQGAGDARLCQVSAGGLLPLPRPLKDASLDPSREVMGLPRSVPSCCPVHGQASRHRTAGLALGAFIYPGTTGRVLLN